MRMDMYAYLRGMKDDLLINNRVDKGREGMEDKSRDARFAGDFGTPEQNIGAFDRLWAWETCMTIGKQWAWKPGEDLKSKEECIHTLLQTIGGDGNLLFNVGPMPDGSLDPRQVEVLNEMGKWISLNQEAVYGTRGGPYMPTRKMVSTHKENKVYLHLLEAPGKKLTLPLEEGIGIKSATVLENGKAISLERKADTFTLKLPASLPNETATVIVLEMDQAASEIEAIKL
jgi:alpha-L-fucosidase